MIPQLHALYQQLTGHTLRLDYSREQQWVLWLTFAGADPAQALRTVVAHLQRGIREGTRNPGSLKFRNLIGQADYFEEDLAEALARSRTKADPSQRSAVLRSTGRLDGKAKHDAPEPPARTAAQVIASAAFQDMVKLKETLKGK